ncbi:MAG: hypothetical protein IPM54_09905 [Polyangiaceae bacterium]|nr:hypothetical protein [Polyangiaceae bacterium]
MLRGDAKPDDNVTSAHEICCARVRYERIVPRIMTAPIIDTDAPSSGVQQEIIVTLVLLEADPLVAHLAPAFDTFYNQKWLPLAAQESALLVEAYRADAIIDVADNALDDFVDELDTVLLRLVAKDRSAPLYAYYFGKKRPHELKRPVLAGQLETMRTFIKPLKTSTDAELSALGHRLEELVSKADDAVARQSAAAEAIKTFRAIGARKAGIDELNALRKSTAGALSEMPHKHPEKHLPADYAARFFKRSPRRGKTAAKEVTSAELKARIAEQEQVLTALNAQLADVLAKEEAAARAHTEATALQLELAEAEKTAAEAAARIAAIKAKLTT